MHKRLRGLVLLVTCLMVMVVLSLLIGARPTAPGDILEALLHRAGAPGDLGVLVWDQRVPRTILAIVVGSAMGLAGAVIQAHTRNPLADPGILGISAGAAFGVVLAIYLLGVSSVTGYVWFGLAGAIVAATLVFTAAAVGGGGANPLGLILAGSALTAFFLALTTAIILVDRASLNELRVWNAGSLAARDLSVVSGVAPFLVVGAVVALLSAPALNVMAVGDDAAVALGVNVALVRVTGLGAVTLLAGAATAATGPIAFLGLVVPHVVRTFTGPDHRWLLPYSAIAGAVLLLAADVLGRVVVRPGELQAGIVLAALGAPFFIVLVRRRKLVSL